MRSVSASCQVMWRRPGTLMMAPAPSRLLLGEAPVDRLDETVSRPCATRVAVAPHISLSRLGSLYVVHRSSRFDQIADPIADDRHHVTVLDDVVLIAEMTVPGD